MGSPSDKFSIRDLQERKRRLAGEAPLPSGPPVTRPTPDAIRGPGPSGPPGAVPAPATAVPEERVDLSVAWEVFIRQWRWIVGAALLGAAFGGWYSYNQAQLYKASATITSDSGDSMLETSAMNWWGGDPLLTDARMLQSRSVLTEAVKRVPEELARFEGEPTEKERKAAETVEAAELAEALHAIPSQEDRLILIEVTALGPRLAAAQANAVAKVYRDKSVEWRQDRANIRSHTLSDAIGRKRGELQELDGKIIGEEQRLAEVGGPIGGLSGEERGRLDVFQSLLFEREKLGIEIEEGETRVETLRQRIEEEAAGASSVPVLAADDPYAERIQKLHIEREGLLVQYTPENPKVRTLDREIERVMELRKKTLTEEVRRTGKGEDPTVTRLRETLALSEVELIAAKDKLKTYDAVLKARSSAILSTANVRLPLENLRSQREVLNKVLTNLEERLAEVTIESGVKESSVRIVDEAIPPDAPNQSGRLATFLKWAGGGWVLGIALAFLLDVFSRTIKGPASIRKELGLRTIGIVPIVSGEEGERIIDPTRPTSLLAEVFGVIRNNIRYGSTDHPERLLLVTSPLPGEGKSLVSANLAIAFALEGSRVVLVDSDVRRRRSDAFHAALGVPREKVDKGLSQFLADPELRLADIAYPTRLEGLSWIPAGERPANPAQLLRSRRVEDIFREVQTHFEVAIVDSAALLPVADAAQIAGQARGILLVLANERTPINAAMQTVERLRHGGSQIVGAIVNRATRYVAGHYYGYSRYGRHGYYPEGEAK